MGRGFAGARTVIVALAAGLALASCAHGPFGKSHNTSSSRGTTGSGGPEVWRLRAGLNVAALSCRRSRAMQRDYSRVLSRHKDLFAATYQAERRRGGSGFDHQQTSLYNHFANQRSPARFCEAASGVAHEASLMNSARLVPSAGPLAKRLERGRR